MAQGEALDRRHIGNPRVDRVNAGPLIHQSSTCLKGAIITAQILGDVADGGALIGRSVENPRVDRVDADHRSFDRTRGINEEL